MEKYDQLIDWLFSQIPNYQNQGGSAYKPGLENIEKLLQEIGNPQELFSSIHLAGTNGKGSTAHILSAIYQANGYKVGLFTSPHLQDFRERIKINGELVDRSFVQDFMESNKEHFKSIGATFFEITTAMAFEAFKTYEVDIAIVETGLGGRLDSTNVLAPELSIITSIGLDHTAFLGDTIPEIAGEKAGIIKANTPVVIGELQVEAEEVVRIKATKENAEVHKAEARSIKMDLLGTYQQANASMALKAVELLNDKFPTHPHEVEKGLMNVAQLTNFRGRLHLIQHKPAFIVDAAHNPAGIENLFKELSEMGYNGFHIIFGASNDKDLREMMKAFDGSFDYYLSEFNSARSTNKTQLKDIADEMGLNYTLYDSPFNAFRMAASACMQNEAIVACGSFFLLEEVYDFIEG